MRVIRFLTQALAAVLVASPMVVVAPAVAVATVPTQLEWQLSPVGTVVYGTEVSIDGQAVYVDPEDGETYAALGTYRLERRYLDSTTWVLVEDQVVDNPFWAVFDFEVAATRSSELRVTYLGDETWMPSEKSAVVRVSRKVKARATEPRANVFYLSGSVVPDYDGKRVDLMRKQCSSCSWRVNDSKRTTSSGSYRFRLPLPPRGASHYFRVRVPGDTHFVRSYSTTYQLLVW